MHVRNLLNLVVPLRVISSKFRIGGKHLQEVTRIDVAFR